jgi:hypothetical protein
MTSTKRVEDQRSQAARELRRGDGVRVRSAEEIAATLDGNGDTDRLPFMPEMLSMCGQSFEVKARADKTCDTINLKGVTRSMTDTVHLVGARCDGSAHGGCQAGCLLFFKETWLERVDTTATNPPRVPVPMADKLAAHTQAGPETYRCQATQLLDATGELDAAGYRHWARDIQTRNASPTQIARAVGLGVINKYQHHSQRLPRRLQIAEGTRLPAVRGHLTKTPTESLDLMPGELVEVKSRHEIFATLNKNQRNRGLWFDKEMLPYCGRQARVLRRVQKIIDEKTGRMTFMKGSCIVLDGFVCSGGMNKLCQRGIYGYWREIWLRRVDEPTPRSTK